MEAVEIKIESSLQILDQRESKLIELADKYKGLTIAGVDDKDGYKKVREARIELKNERVAVENDAYALRENAVKFQKAVITREKQLVAIVSTTEKTLQHEEDKYKKALEEIRIQKEREEKERIQARINALSKFNCAIDLYDASTMSDDRFNELLTQAEIDYNAEQDRITQEKAELERQRNEEAARLRAEREEIERIRKEQEARERELQIQEQERIAAEKKRQEEIRAEASRIRKEQEDQQRAIELQRLQVEKAKAEFEEQVRIEQAKKEAAERARIEEQERIKRETEEKAERERLAKIEAERQEALKPDKEKLFQYARALMGVIVPELSHKDAQMILGEISERVVQTAEFIHDKALSL